MRGSSLVPLSLQVETIQAFQAGLRHRRESLVKANIMHNLISCDDVHTAHSKLLSSDSLNMHYADLFELGWEQGWHVREERA